MTYTQLRGPGIAMPPRGPRGYTGDVTPAALDAKSAAEAAASDAVAAADTVTALVPDSDDAGAFLRATGPGQYVWEPRVLPAFSDIINKLILGTPINIAMFGDSKIFGLLTSGSQSSRPIPSVLKLALNTIPGWTADVQNYGRSGDKASDSLTYWLTNPPVFGDATIFAFGTNEALQNQSLNVFRSNYQKFIDWARSQGSPPIALLGPDGALGFGVMQGWNKKFRAYANVVRELAEKNQCLYIDMEQQLRWMKSNARGGDYLHLTDRGYNSAGWDLAAPFISYGAGAPRSVAAGMALFPSGDIGFGTSAGNVFTDVYAALGVDFDGFAAQINSGEYLALAVYCEQDVELRVWHYNGNSPGAVNRRIHITTGGWDGSSSESFSGVPVVSDTNDATVSVMKMVRGPTLARGWRFVQIDAYGGNPAYITRIDFAPVSPVRAYTAIIAGHNGSPMTLGTVFAEYELSGGRCHLNLRIPITANNAAAGGVDFTLPVPPRANNFGGEFVGTDTSSNALLHGRIQSGFGTIWKIDLAGNSYSAHPGSDGAELRISGWYWV